MSDGSVPSLHNYGVLLTTVMAGVVTGFSILIVYLLPLLISERSVLGLALLIPVALFVALLLKALLSRAAINVGVDEVAAKVCGIKTRRIPWHQVGKVKKVRVTNGYQYVDIYHIVPRQDRGRACEFFVNFCGDIVFTQDISNLRGLLDHINVFAQQFQVPLVVFDTEAAAAKIRNEKTPRYWQKIEEIPVAEL